MKLAVFIGFLEGKLKEQKELAVSPLTSQRDEYLINMEVQLTFKELQSTIDQLRASGEDKEMTADHAKIFTDFLEKRWERIKNTDAIYNIALRNSPANLLCRQAALFLAGEKALVKNKNYLALLMPTVKSWRNARTGHEYANLYMHNFLLTDDNHYPIEIGYLVEDIKENRLSISHKEGEAGVRLTVSEAERVMNHTSAVSAYYASMKKLLRNKDYNQDEISSIKLKLRESLSTEDYERNTIRSTYGNAGYSLLKSNLFKRVDDLFLNREQLFDLLSSSIMPEAKWKEFVASISSPVLAKLINNGSSLEYTVQSDALYSGDDKHDKAVLFCLACAYWRERDQKGNYTSISGFLFGYDKVTKKNAVDVIIDFLVSDKPIGEWKSFVGLNHKDLSGAINDGTVGHISKHIEAIEEKKRALQNQAVATNKPAMVKK